MRSARLPFRHRWTLSLASLLILTLLLGLCHWLTVNDPPTYDGRSFHEWTVLAVNNDPRALPALRDALRHRNAEVRRSAAYYLTFLGPNAHAATPELLNCLKDPDGNVRQASVQTLAMIGAGNIDVVTALSAALQDESPEVRQMAELALRNAKVGALSGNMTGSIVASACSPQGPSGLSAIATWISWSQAIDKAQWQLKKQP